jgi:hypothetical protein
VPLLPFLNGRFAMMDVGDVPIYLRPGFTDGRKAIDGLVGVIQEQMKMDVLQGGLFIFCSKAKTTIKCILWDGTGFWYIHKLFCFRDNFCYLNHNSYSAFNTNFLQRKQERAEMSE